MNRPVINNINIKIKKGQILGIVGESGCGKTTLAKAVIGALPKCGTINGGSIDFLGTDLIHISSKDRKEIQGNGLGIVIQESLSSLNPVRRVGAQFSHMLREKLGVSKEESENMVYEFLDKVNCPSGIFHRFPFQISGGQRQRVIIAMAFALRPKLLIADEPTTALDVTIQAQILREMMTLKEEYETGIIIISHNLGVVAQICDEVAVMYNGRVVEYGASKKILEKPSHPYTIGLIKSIPRIDFTGSERLYNIPDSKEEYVSGCVFADRCPNAKEICLKNMPELKKNKDGVFVACVN